MIGPLVSITLALVNTSAIPEIHSLGSCKVPDEIKLANDLQALRKYDIETLRKYAVQNCESEFVSYWPRHLSNETVVSLVESAPPTELMGEAIRWQSGGLHLRDFKGGIELHEATVSLTEMHPDQSGYEFIRIHQSATPQQGKWHVDPGCPRRARWMFVLERRNIGANIDFVHPTSITETIVALNNYTPDNELITSLDSVLDVLGCTHPLHVGDVLRFRGAVYHRTQNNDGYRLSVQIAA